MDEIIDFLANNTIIMAIVGLILLLLKIIVVILLIKTKKPSVELTKKSFNSVFNKTYDRDDIKKSRDAKRVFYKKLNNSFKIIAYVWLVVFCFSLFLRFAALGNNGEMPIENNRPAPTTTEQ